MADFREEGSHHDLNDPPPDYGLYMESSRPPPYNPNLREGQGEERSGGTLRNTCKNAKIIVCVWRAAIFLTVLAIESMFLSQEEVPNQFRTGTFRPRVEANDVGVTVNVWFLPFVMGCNSE